MDRIFEQQLFQEFGVKVVTIRDMKTYEVWYTSGGENRYFITCAFDKDQALANLMKHLDGEPIEENR